MVPNADEFESELATLLVLARRARAAEIDASACGTSADFNKLMEADMKYDEAYAKFLKKWTPKS